MIDVRGGGVAHGRQIRARPAICIGRHRHNRERTCRNPAIRTICRCGGRACPNSCSPMPTSSPRASSTPSRSQWTTRSCSTGPAGPTGGAGDGRADSSARRLDGRPRRRWPTQSWRGARRPATSPAAPGCRCPTCWPATDRPRTPTAAARRPQRGLGRQHDRDRRGLALMSPYSEALIPDVTNAHAAGARRRAETLEATRLAPIHTVLTGGPFDEPRLGSARRARTSRWRQAVPAPMPRSHPAHGEHRDCAVATPIPHQLGMVRRQPPAARDPRRARRMVRRRPAGSRIPLHRQPPAGAARPRGRLARPRRDRARYEDVAVQGSRVGRPGRRRAAWSRARTRRARRPQRA